MHEELEALWVTVQQNWQDRGAHDRFLAACHAHSMLGFAAQRYAGMLTDAGRAAAQLPDSPELRALVDKRLAAISLLALQSMESDRTMPRKAIPRWLQISAGVLVFGTLLWLGYVALR